MAVSNMMIFSGNANPGLALQAANRFKMVLGQSVRKVSKGHPGPLGQKESGNPLWLPEFHCHR